MVNNKARGKTLRWLLDGAWLREALLRRWSWALVISMALAVGGATWGSRNVRYPGAVIVIRNDSLAVPSRSNAAQQGGMQRDTVLPVAEIIRSPELLQRVALRPGMNLTVDELSRYLEVRPMPGTESWQVRFAGNTPMEAAAVAQNCAEEALNQVAETQAKEAEGWREFLRNKLTEVDQALASAHEKLASSVQEAGFVDMDKGLSTHLQQHEGLNAKLEDIRIRMETLDLQINSLLRVIALHHPALLSAKQALDQALLKYTEEHPKVQELRTNIVAIELRIAAQSAQGDPEIALNGSSLAQGLYAKVIELRTEKVTLGKQWEQTESQKVQLERTVAKLSEKQLSYLKAKSDYESLRHARELLNTWQEQNQLSQGAAAGSFRIMQGEKLTGSSALVKVKVGSLWAGASAILGLMAAGLLIALVEISDRRIRSALELELITGAPVLATLGDLRQMSEEERKSWAFRTFTTLQGKLASQTQEALVCGFISSEPGEGRSTWVELLAEAARQRGYRVITLIFNKGKEQAETGCENAAPPASTMLVPHDLPRTALSTEVQPMVEIPVSAWAWNLERRTQWQEALNQLKSMENLVVLIELPAASVPEAVLLSENFGPLIWLAAKDKADAATTAMQLETLRNARAQVTGAVVNELAPRGRSRRFGKVAAMLGLVFAGLIGTLPAQPTNTVPLAVVQTENAPVMGVSASGQAQLADWQKRLTLGPGDSLQVGLYGQADTLRANLTIGPDGRLNYLQARDFVAAGMTVDELRDELEKVLLKFYRPPLRVMVIPQAYRSKKFYMLGNVTQTGVFPLERPITLIEAIASAGGFVNSIQRRGSFTLVDFSRSFLVRKEAAGQFKRVPVNFDSLFTQGDLRENIMLAPDDYLYFAPQDLPEIYVLGEVGRPGVTAYTPGLTVVKAIAAAGGMTPRAWRQKVLIVRGSLNRPTTHTFNMAQALAGKTVDFKLENRDIIYVYRKPWAKAEELLEMAISDFVRAAVVQYAGAHVGPFITEPIIK